MLIKFGGNLISVKLQLLNAPLPISVILSGKTMLSNRLQLETSPLLI